jgi:hypothetical protein
LKEKSNNAEAVVASAVNRVLGVTTQSTVPGDPHEEMIMNALRTMLNQIPGANIKPSQSAPSNQERPQMQQHQSQQRSAQSQTNSAQGNMAQHAVKLTGQEKTGPTVMRPSFTGQGQSRPSGPSVSRPPMMTPGMKRTNSGSPANAPPRPSATSSASPAPASSGGNGTSTPRLTVHENGQIAGQKRSLDDTDDMREFKRLSTSGPRQLRT